MTTLEQKIKFFESEFNADINKTDCDTYASIPLNEEPAFGEVTKEMIKIWEKVGEKFPGLEGNMGSVFDDGDYSFITFKIS